MHVIGIDCAVDPKNVGLALSHVQGEILVIHQVLTCKRILPSEVVSRWIASLTTGPVLLALDAPLGWPHTMSRALATHVAGDALTVTPNELFRRETDRHIQSEYSKTPLDVGADRIARTAHAALRLLADLRHATGHDIPLAWNPLSVATVSAIEVYPAATLRKHGFHAARPPADRSQAVADFMQDRVVMDGVQLPTNPHAMDAVLCAFAGLEFLTGRASPPQHDIMSIALQEGWIWT
jgi:hypothetical protein